MIYDLVVIGAGPAGIASAVEANKNGLKNVLLIEKASENCQTFRTYYKDGKRVDKVYNKIDIPNEGTIPFEDGNKEGTLELFTSLCDGSFEVMLSNEVEKIKQVDGNLVVYSSKGEFKTKNAIIAIGRMGKPNKPSYKLPSKLNKVINFNANDAKDGEKILVVGGGNSAVEYAVDLSKKANVTLCYRRAEFSRINETNHKNVYEAKLTLKLATDISEVNEVDNKPEVTYTNGEKEVFDRIIYGIGGSTPVDFLTNSGVEIDDKGVPTFDANMQTNVSNIYVAGDIASKNGESIITALNHAKKIADFITKA